MTTLAIFNLNQIVDSANKHNNIWHLLILVIIAIILIGIVGVVIAICIEDPTFILLTVVALCFGVALYIALRDTQTTNSSATELISPIKNSTILLNNPDITTDASHKDLDETVSVYYSDNGSKTKLATITKINTNNGADTQIEVNPASELGKCYVKVADYVATKDLSEQPQLEIGKDYVKAKIVYANGKKENVTSRVSDNNQSDSDKDTKKVNL